MLKEGLKEFSIVELRAMLETYRQKQKAFDESVAMQPRLIDAFCRLATNCGRGNLMETFNEMAAMESDLMRLVFQASITRFMNIYMIDSVGEELKRRAVKWN